MLYDCNKSRVVRVVLKVIWIYPKTEQTVQTFLYLSVFSEEQKKKGEYKDLTENDLSKLDENTPITTDEYLYEISQIKEKNQPAIVDRDERNRNGLPRTHTRP